MKLCTCPGLHALYDDKGVVKCTKCSGVVDACKARSYRIYLKAKKEEEENDIKMGR